MNDLATFVFGPLAAPECARASRRGWLIWVRMVPAIAAGVVTFVTLWIWWIFQQLDPAHLYMPSNELRVALGILEGMFIAVALILAPAVLAGSLAGEKERGSIGLLLTTRVSSADIVMGRLAGRLCQLAMIELAALPALILLSSLAGSTWGELAAMLLLPTAVALGSSGIALAASAISRRGRDALMLVYLIEVLFLLAPILGGAVGWPVLDVLNPFRPLGEINRRGAVASMLITSATWGVFGVAGLALASWRLRPSCLSEGSDARQKKRARRRGWVPPLDDRPMLWKELYIEKVGTLGRAGRWIGALLVLGMTLGSVGLAGYAAYGYLVPHTEEWASQAASLSSTWFGNSALFIGFLIQWAIGLRAAVTISSERERGTWDALLTSPLEGTEIVRGKLWGSLWALKWLIGSAVLAWSITLALGGMSWPEYVESLASLITVGTFMSAVGVRTSLRSATATRAMGVTIAFWLGGCILATAIAWAACVAVAAACLIGWLYAVQFGLSTMNSGPWFPMTFRLGANLVYHSEFLIVAFLIVAETRVRFDRVAGRMTAGKAALAVDNLLFGPPMAPVRLDKEKSRVPEMDEVAG